MGVEQAGGGGVGHFEAMRRVPGLDGGGLPGAELVLGGPDTGRRYARARNVLGSRDEVGVADQDDTGVSRIRQSVLDM